MNKLFLIFIALILYPSILSRLHATEAQPKVSHTLTCHGIFLKAKASLMAKKAHHNQWRKKGLKYPPRPYIEHPFEVAAILEKYIPRVPTEIIVTALLHDTLEDTSLKAEQIEAEFGPRVLEYTLWLTLPQELPPRDKRDYQIQTIQHMPREARWIKVADKLANIREATYNPPIEWSHSTIMRNRETAIQVIAAAGPLPEGLTRLIQEMQLEEDVLRAKRQMNLYDLSSIIITTFSL